MNKLNLCAVAALVATLVIGGVLAAHAQDGDLRAAILAVRDDGFPVVTAYLNVTDGRGLPVSGAQATTNDPTSRKQAATLLTPELSRPRTGRSLAESPIRWSRPPALRKGGEGRDG